jgi:hypothetical protein
MDTTGRRRSRNVEDRRSTGLATPLAIYDGTDQSFRGYMDGTGTAKILPYRTTPYEEIPSWDPVNRARKGDRLDRRGKGDRLPYRRRRTLAEEP